MPLPGGPSSVRFSTPATRLPLYRTTDLDVTKVNALVRENQGAALLCPEAVRAFSIPKEVLSPPPRTYPPGGSLTQTPAHQGVPPAQGADPLANRGHTPRRGEEGRGG